MSQTVRSAEREEIQATRKTTTNVPIHIPIPHKSTKQVVDQEKSCKNTVEIQPTGKTTLTSDTCNTTNIQGIDDSDQVTQQHGNLMSPTKDIPEMVEIQSTGKTTLTTDMCNTTNIQGMEDSDQMTRKCGNLTKTTSNIPLETVTISSLEKNTDSSTPHTTLDMVENESIKKKITNQSRPLHNPKWQNVKKKLRRRRFWASFKL